MYELKKSRVLFFGASTISATAILTVTGSSFAPAAAMLIPAVVALFLFPGGRCRICRHAFRAPAGIPDKRDGYPA